MHALDLLLLGMCDALHGNPHKIYSAMLQHNTAPCLCVTPPKNQLAEILRVSPRKAVGITLGRSGLFSKLTAVQEQITGVCGLCTSTFQK